MSSIVQSSNPVQWSSPTNRDCLLDFVFKVANAMIMNTLWLSSTIHLNHSVTLLNFVLNTNTVIECSMLYTYDCNYARVIFDQWETRAHLQWWSRAETILPNWVERSLKKTEGRVNWWKRSPISPPLRQKEGKCRSTRRLTLARGPVNKYLSVSMGKWYSLEKESVVIVSWHLTHS